MGLRWGGRSGVGLGGMGQGVLERDSMGLLAVEITSSYMTVFYSHDKAVLSMACAE